MRERLRYVVVCAGHICIFLGILSIYSLTEVSRNTYTGQDAIQPVQNLLSNSSHCYLGSGILLLPEAIRK
jgi:hypothetical protein